MQQYTKTLLLSEKFNIAGINAGNVRVLVRETTDTHLL